jgi:hypothetical protein
MGSTTRQLAYEEALREAAMSLLVETGAVAECETDPGIFINQSRGTEGARNLGLKLIKTKDRRVSAFKNKQDLSNAIDQAFETAQDRCPLCAKRVAQ